MKKGADSKWRSSVGDWQVLRGGKGLGGVLLGALDGGGVFCAVRGVGKGVLWRDFARAWVRGGAYVASMCASMGSGGPCVATLG